MSHAQNTGISDLDALAGASVASGDKVRVYDVSSGEEKAVTFSGLNTAIPGSGYSTPSEVVTGFEGDESATTDLSNALADAPGSVRELVAGLNALLLYLDIDPAVLVDDNGDPLVDDNNNLIIG